MNGTTAILAGVAMTAALTTTALAKEFKVEGIGCYGGESKLITHTYDRESKPAKSHFAWSFESMGVTRGTLALVGEKGAARHCVGTGAFINGVRHESGYCEGRVSKADTWLTKWEGTNGKGTWTIVSGSGKYAGVTGQGTWQSEGRYPRFRAGTFQGCSRNQGTLTLPD